MSLKLTADDYRVGWICPLELEQTAAMEMLDEEHEPLEQSADDHNVYKLGSIHGHNVVIAGLPQTGNSSMAAVVTQMRMSFKKLRYGLLVGIGGGVPVETDNGTIRLGDVVVSKPTDEHSGVIQYDHGKAIDGFIECTDSLMPPPAALLNAAQALAVEQGRSDNDPIWENTQRIRTQRRGLRHFKFPGIANDHLYQPDYNHQQMGMTCEEGGCNPEQRIERPVEEDDECFIVVHRGTIASGELVIKDAKKRDFLAQKYNLLCFETEAAGALTDFPCLVIRGISDYCDSHKNNKWQGFAAAAAAAYARRLFFHMSTELEEEIYVRPTAFDLRSYLPGKIPDFIARKEELTEMQEALRPTARLHRRRTVLLHGLGGIGKTQLAIEYAQRHREQYSTNIWLDARNETTINEGFAQLAERILAKQRVTYIQIALDSEDQSIILKAVKRWLDEPANESWLIIYDDYDYHDFTNSHSEDEELLGISSQNTLSMNPSGQGKEVRSQSYDIRKYLPEADHGTIIIISRVSSKMLGRPIEISKLKSLDDCLEILASTSGRNITDDPAAVDLVKRLDGLPLALASAGAYLGRVPINCTDYLQDYSLSGLNPASANAAESVDTAISKYVASEHPDDSIFTAESTYVAETVDTEVSEHADTKNLGPKYPGGSTLTEPVYAAESVYSADFNIQRLKKEVYIFSFANDLLSSVITEKLHNDSIDIINKALLRLLKIFAIKLRSVNSKQIYGDVIIFVRKYRNEITQAMKDIYTEERDNHNNIPIENMFEDRINNWSLDMDNLEDPNTALNEDPEKSIDNALDNDYGEDLEAAN